MAGRSLADAPCELEAFVRPADLAEDARKAVERVDAVGRHLERLLQRLDGSGPFAVREMEQPDRDERFGLILLDLEHALCDLARRAYDRALGDIVAVGP